MINFQGFLETLPILLYGMVGIFIVIMIVGLVIKLLCWLFPEKKGHKG